MGTVASLDVAEPSPSVLERVEAVFASADARFSLYRADSELSGINAGRTGLLDASDAVRDAYAIASDWRARTDGAFTPTRPDGALDLNGVVKALAMRDAGRELTALGFDDWTLVVGGDMLASGCASDGAPWRTGIVDPADRTALLCAVDLTGSRRAIATSGSAERGDHIWLAGASTPFVQVTVVADDIVTADVLATAIVSGGQAALQDAAERWSIDVLTVDREGGLMATPGLRASLSPAALTLLPDTPALG
ncbi:MAG: FAD:protein FMN transferase [Pseudolysinimonas sp.]